MENRCIYIYIDEIARKHMQFNLQSFFPRISCDYLKLSKKHFVPIWQVGKNEKKL